MMNDVDENSMIVFGSHEIYFDPILEHIGNHWLVGVCSDIFILIVLWGFVFVSKENTKEQKTSLWHITSQPMQSFVAVI